MMGHREKLINGNEVDFFSRSWRKFYKWHNSWKIKRAFWKRIRKQNKAELERLIDESISTR